MMEEFSIEKATELLGLGSEFGNDELEYAFKTKCITLEIGRSEAKMDAVKKGYESGLKELETAYNILLSIKPKEAIVDSDIQLKMESHLSMFGLKSPFSEFDLKKKYEQQCTILEDKVKNASMEPVRIGYQNGLKEIEEGYWFLLRFASENKSNIEPKEKEVSEKAIQEKNKDEVKIAEKGAGKNEKSGKDKLVQSVGIDGKLFSSSNSSTEDDAKTSKAAPTQDSASSLSLIFSGILVTVFGMFWLLSLERSYKFATIGEMYFWGIGVIVSFNVSMNIFSEGLTPAIVKDKIKPVMSLGILIAVAFILYYFVGVLYAWAEVQADCEYTMWHYYHFLADVGKSIVIVIYIGGQLILMIVGLINPENIKFKNERQVLKAIGFNVLVAIALFMAISH